MKRIGTGLLAAVFAVAMAQAAIACDKEAKGGCSKTQATTASAVTADGAVVNEGVDQVMATLPKMTYRVGSVDTPCAQTAAATAAKTGEPVQYVVAGEAYGCRQTAMDKLAEAIQGQVPQLAKVVHVVDGEALNCAESAAKLAAERKSNVKHLVAGVSFDCPQHAQQVADRLAAKLASSHGCAKAFKEGCSKDGEAATASATGGCSKSKGAEAATASAGGCSKSHGAAAATASTGGCSKSHGAEAAEAKTASTTEVKGGCCSKSKGADAETASATTGGCTKSAGAEAKTAAAGEAKGGCCSKAKAAAQTAAADAKETTTTVTAEAAGEETPQLANAKLLVREIVEFVANSRNS